MVVEHHSHCELTLMFTDIVGYSRLMGRNESLAIEMLGDYRKILLAHIESQDGLVVEFIGDAVFARFPSANAAIAAAIAIQQHLLAFNEVRDKKLPRLQTRIGLHKGEVTLRDNAVFGDSVNIAARLEPLAVADGICISQAVYDDVRLTLSSPAKRLGVQALKNIQQKIRVYLIKPAGIGWRDHLHYFLRGLNKNIIAYRYPLTACLFALIAAGFYFIPRWLVPGYAANYVEIADFRNLMDSKGESDYFSAGITAAVRSQLADMRDVYIVDAKEGIHAPIRLEGSVQKLDDNLRISYRLFRRKDNVQIAGGKLDGTYQDIFILQDRLVGEIARYLAEEFDLQNFRPAPLRLTGDVTAYDYYLRGVALLELPMSRESIDEAIQTFTASLIHDASFSQAHVGLCKSYWRNYELLSSERWLSEAEKHCLTALSIDESSLQAMGVLGSIYRDIGEHEKAIQYLNRGSSGKINSTEIDLALVYDEIGKKDKAESIFVNEIKNNKKNWRAYVSYGYFLINNGRVKDAIKIYNEILAFVPENYSVLTNLGKCYFSLGEFEMALLSFERAREIQKTSAIYSNIGSVYYILRDFERAAEAYEVAHQLDPDNYQWMSHLGDAYKFVPGRKEDAKRVFLASVRAADRSISLNPNIDKAYHYLAIGLAYLNEPKRAGAALDAATKINSDNVDLLYAKLRVAAFSGDNTFVDSHVNDLVDFGYDKKLLVLDPDLNR